MKAFFDTSVLLPIFHTGHLHHEASLACVERHSSKQSYCGSHSLAEVYSSLTRMPPPLRARPEQAILYVANLRDRFNLITLEPEEIFQALDDFAANGIVGGTTYDGLLAKCALKAKAEVIYTWNVRHYRLLGPEVEKRLRTP